LIIGVQVAVVVVLAIALGLIFGLQKTPSTPSSSPEQQLAGFGLDDAYRMPDARMAAQRMRTMDSMYKRKQPQKIYLAGGLANISSPDVLPASAATLAITEPASYPNKAQAPAAERSDDNGAQPSGPEVIDGPAAVAILEGEETAIIIVVSPTCGACNALKNTMYSLFMNGTLGASDNIKVMPASQIAAAKGKFDEVVSVPHLFKTSQGKKIAQRVGNLPSQELVQFVRSM
jgi:hypothetical protein